jgi:hypothetical protein
MTDPLSLALYEHRQEVYESCKIKDKLRQNPIMELFLKKCIKRYYGNCCVPTPRQINELIENCLKTDENIDDFYSKCLVCDMYFDEQPIETLYKNLPVLLCSTACIRRMDNGKNC